jgi:two-component system cell cycle sensor histidine kinase/response regulator CckA
VPRASRTREHLAVSEARLARAQHIAGLGDWELDLATGVTTSSVEARRILGLGAEGPQVDGDALWACVHPDDRDTLSRALSGGAAVPARLDVRVVLPDGEERVAHIQAEVVGDDRNRRVVATIQDVTDRTWLEAQLRQSQKLEAVGKLAGGIAHDFGNLLSVINVRSRLLLDGLADAPQPLRHVEIIREAGERAVALTRQLLAFSRNQVLERTALDLNAVVTDLDVLVRELVGERIVPVVELAPELATVSADPIQIEQVILNLIVNARDAMPDGGQLSISTTNVDLDVAFARRHPGAQPGRHVALTIRDTGVGMDPAVCARVFEPFFSTKDPEKRTGLGLATVYGIVQQHGGYISVESEPGRGSVFTVYLATVTSATDGREPTMPARQSGERVLTP